MNTCLQEAEAGVFELFWDSQGYTMSPNLKKESKQTSKQVRTHTPNKILSLLKSVD